MDISEEIKKFRDERGLSQTELAREAGVSKSEISYLESGRHNPNIVTLVKFKRIGLNLIDKFLDNL